MKVEGKKAKVATFAKATACQGKRRRRGKNEAVRRVEPICTRIFLVRGDQSRGVEDTEIKRCGSQPSGILLRRGYSESFREQAAGQEGPADWFTGSSSETWS